MPNYLINKNDDSKGYNEVHKTDCIHLPEYQNRVNLGWFSNDTEAVNYAKTHGYPHADGCYYCCNSAHHG